MAPSADTIRSHSYAAIVVMFALSWAGILGYSICAWFNFLYGIYRDHYESKGKEIEEERQKFLTVQRTHLMDLERLKNQYDPIHLLFTKIHAALEAKRRRESRDGDDDDGGRVRLLEDSEGRRSKCAICSGEFVSDDDNCDEITSIQWVTVMPGCHHICHTGCASERFASRTNTCPACPFFNAASKDLKDLKEIMIIVKPIDTLVVPWTPR